MESRIIRIEGLYEIWGFFFEGKLIRTNKLRVRGWR